MDAVLSPCLFSTQRHEVASQRIPPHGFQHFAVDELLCFLQVCSGIKDRDYVRRLHLHICEAGLDTHHVIGNHLVPVLVDCGSASDAEQALSRLYSGDGSSWASAISVFIENNYFENAFDLYRRMQDHLLFPGKHTLLALLGACSYLKSLEMGRELHIHAAKNDFESDVHIGSSLVTMYSKCGVIADAQKVHDNLPERNVVAWTALISGLADNGHGEEAIICFHRMQSEGICPNAVTYVSSLRACAMAENLFSGKDLHSDIAQEGFEKDFLVGSTLVDMYAKCGAMVEAQEVFHELLAKDTVTWTALISGFVLNEMEEDALSCLDKMQSEGRSPDSVTFLFIVKACGNIRDMNTGQMIHTEIVSRGYDQDLCISNALIDMYLRGGFLTHAEQIFNNLAQRDAVTWTVLLSGYTDNGLNEEALDCVERMRLEGYPLDAVMFLYCLKACGSLMDIRKARMMHAEIIQEGFENDQFIGCALLEMYAKCSLLTEAEEIFSDFPRRDTILWNSLLGGFAYQGYAKEVLKYFEKMELQGSHCDPFTFVCCLKASSSLKLLEVGHELHLNVTKRGFEHDPFVINAVVHMYAKCSSFKDATEILDTFPASDEAPWNALMAGLIEEGLCEQLSKCLQYMEREGLALDIGTLIFCLKACTVIGDMDKGRKLHSQIIIRGFGKHTFLSNTLLDMYVKCGLLAEAQNVFNELRIQCSASWTSLIMGYAEKGRGNEALDCFQQMLLGGIVPELLTWNALISGFSEQDNCDKAFKVFYTMQEQGFLPENATFVSVLKACSSNSALQAGKTMHAQMCRATKAEFIDVQQSTTLINMYNKCGKVGLAQIVFDAMPTKDLVAWNALIMGYAQIGQSKCVMNAFETMLEQNVKPDGVSFLNILSVCNHDGLVQQGQRYFEIMTQDYRLSPSIDHYTSVVDLLSRAGQLDEAMGLIYCMPIQPDVALLNTILSSCYKCGDKRLGERIFQNVVAGGDIQSASFTMMSNIYAVTSNGNDMFVE